MSGRLRRIRRIAELRERELEQAQQVLSERRGEEDVALEAAKVARAAVGRAEDARRRLASEGGEIESFQAADDWYGTLVERYQAAVASAYAAHQATERARARVAQSKMQLEQIETLQTRVESVEQRAAQRAERRSEDEIAARMASRRAHSQRT